MSETLSQEQLHMIKESALLAIERIEELEAELATLRKKVIRVCECGGLVIGPLTYPCDRCGSIVTDGLVEVEWFKLRTERDGLAATLLTIMQELSQSDDDISVYIVKNALLNIADPAAILAKRDREMMARGAILFGAKIHADQIESGDDFFSSYQDPRIKAVEFAAAIRAEKVNRNQHHD